MNKSSLKEIFIESCEKLDIRILEFQMDSEEVLFSLDKYRFLAYLNNLFIDAKNKEIMGLVMVKKYCMVCHQNKEILEFYSKERAVEYYRYASSRKKIIPVFAFADVSTRNRFDIEPCSESWGYTKCRRYIDVQNVRKAIATTELTGIR